MEQREERKQRKGEYYIRIAKEVMALKPIIASCTSVHVERR
jgi:hypothetical protein